MDLGNFLKLEENWSLGSVFNMKVVKDASVDNIVLCNLTEDNLDVTDVLDAEIQIVDVVSGYDVDEKYHRLSITVTTGNGDTHRMTMCSYKITDLINILQHLEANNIDLC